MTLITRITRLFKADIHGILDYIEEPHAVLKQAVREMQSEVEATEEQLKALSGKQVDNERAGKERDEALTEFTEQLSLCFKADNDTLARSTLRRKLETEKQRVAITRDAARYALERKALEERLAEQRDRLVGICEKASLFLQEGESESPWHEHARGSRHWVSDEDVEIAFLREKELWQSAAAMKEEA